MQKIRNEFAKSKNYEFEKEYDEENLINTFYILIMTSQVNLERSHIR